MMDKHKWIFADSHKKRIKKEANTNEDGGDCR